MKSVCLWILVLLLIPIKSFSSAIDKNTVLLLNFEKDSLVMKGAELIKVTDLSGNKNDAFVNTQGGESAKKLNVKPSGPPAVIEGKFGSALYFDGTNFLEVLTSKTLEITSQITIEAWIKPDVLTLGADNMTVLTKDCAYYMVLRDNGFLANYLYGTTSPGYHLSKKPLKAQEWSHIAITFDGKKIILYIDGQVDNTIDSKGEILISGCGNPQSIGIGCEVRIPERGEANHRYYKGAIDEVRVSNIARTADEIKESFTSGLQLSVSAKDKLTDTWGRIKIN